MNKQFIKVLLCGAMVLSTGTFISCNNDDDIDDLKSRVSVVETAIGDLKADLDKALKTGASIVEVKLDEKTGIYTLSLSDGQKIVIKPGGGNISVTMTDTEAIINVNGTEYKLPLGSAVNSLIYSPETIDGIVEIGNTGAIVKFLPRPALTSIEGAEFTIAESHVLTRAADGEQFKVNGVASLDGGFIVVPIKALGEAEAGKMYAVSLQMKFRGTVIGSNYFNVKVADDFSAVAEDLGGVTIKADYAPRDLADGFKEMTINGLDLLGTLNFNNLFSELPDKAEFIVASSSKQPGGKAQEKVDMLKESLKSDGTWKFSTRPGTSFNDNEERPGFLLNVVADDVVKAKIYVVIVDELADVDFTANGLVGNYEAEWGGTEKAQPLGAGKLNFPRALSKYETDIPTIHNGADGFFPNWLKYSIKMGDEELIFNNGSTLEMGDLAKKYAEGCRGIYYFFRGFAVYVPASLGTDGKYTDVNGKTYDAGEGYGYDGWMGQYNEYINDPVGFYNNIKEWGFGDFTMDEKTGDFNFPESYTGYGLRIAFDAGYEYAYGVKPLHAAGADQLGMLFINRRVAPEGATMPAPKP